MTPPSKPPSKPLPEADNVLERLYEGDAPESTESNIRYAGYGMRIRTLLSAAHRYVAYTSDIGESFRPVAHPWLVRGAYGVSWAYITGDVFYEGYKAYLNNKAMQWGLPPPHPFPHHHTHPIPTTTTSTSPPSKPPTTQLTAPPSVIATLPSIPTTLASSPAPYHIPLQDDYRTIILSRFLFQTLASMALPAFTIHSVVRYSGRAMKTVKNPKLRTWGPVGLGLAVVPALPYLFDEPVEWAVERGVEQVAEWVEGGGKRTADKEVGGRREL